MTHNHLRDQTKTKNRQFKHDDYFSCLCISATQLVKACLIGLFPSFLPIYYLFQILGSVGEGTLSDVFKRKNYLVLSLVVLVLSTAFIWLNHHFFSGSNLINIIASLAIALGGNADIMGRNTLIDSHVNVERRAVLGWTIVSESLSWVMLGLLMIILNIQLIDAILISFSVSVVLFFWSFFIKDDVQGEGNFIAHFKHYNHLRIHSFPILKMGIMMVLILEAGFFFFFYDQEERIISRLFEAESMIAWATPLVIAAFLQTKIKKHGEFFFIISGIIISIVGMVLFIPFGFVVSYYNFSEDWNIVPFVIIGFGSGFFLPCLYSLFSKAGDVHQQGMLTGSVDSLRTTAEFSTTWIQSRISKFGPLPAYLISLTLFVVSFLSTLIFRKKGLFKHLKNKGL